jgi:hypothetical protein
MVMKHFLILSCIVFLVMSCHNGNMDNKNNGEPKFFTVTYHGNGHTSGEVPIDPNEYKEGDRIIVLPDMSQLGLSFPWDLYKMENFIKKDGYTFMGWGYFDFPYFREDGTTWGMWPEQRLGLHHSVIEDLVQMGMTDKHIIFKAAWSPEPDR